MSKKWWQHKTVGDMFAARNLDRPVSKFGGVTLDRPQGVIEFEGASYPLPATARVETAGEIRERVTATRLVAVGILAFAFKKKKDARELYLTVEGSGWQFVASVDPRQGAQARQFAAAITSVQVTK